MPGHDHSSMETRRARGERPKFAHPCNTAPWIVRMESDDLQKLLRGFSPTMMEDKWAVRAHGPDSEGTYTVFLMRSWTMTPIVAVKISPEQDEGKLGKDGALRITELIWDKEYLGYYGNPLEEKEAREMITGSFKHLLKVELPDTE
jgi:hypothetical protein